MKKRNILATAGAIVSAGLILWLLVSVLDVNEHNLTDRECADWNCFTVLETARAETSAAPAEAKEQPESPAVHCQKRTSDVKKKSRQKKAVKKTQRKKDSRKRFVKKKTYISDRYVDYAFTIAEPKNISPELVVAIIEKESDGRCLKPNSDGDIGLMQVNPKWWRERLKKLGVTDLLNPYENITAGVDILHELAKTYGDMYEVLMFYNMGYKGIELARKGVYSKYARTVMARARELEGE